MSEYTNVKTFEQKVATEYSPDLSVICLNLGKIAMDFSRVDRIPRYADSERESDVEHSYMLALVAPELAEKLELGLDTGLLSQFAIVHDLIELKTKDVATLLLSETELHQKEIAERIALSELLSELPPHTAHLLTRYECQAEPEARFVRYVDKLLPLVVDILGNGARVMKEDYRLYSPEAVEDAHINVHERIVKRFGDEFNGIAETHLSLARQFRESLE